MLREVATAPMAVIKSMFRAVITNILTTNTTTYRMVKANKLSMISGGTELLFIIIGMMARGCKRRLNSANPFLTNNTIRTILKPPLVLPADAPENIIKKNNMVANEPHNW